MLTSKGRGKQLGTDATAPPPLSPAGGGRRATDAAAAVRPNPGPAPIDARLKVTHRPAARGAFGGALAVRDKATGAAAEAFYGDVLVHEDPPGVRRFMRGVARRGYVADINVPAGRRDKGVGSAVLARLLRELDARGVDRVYLIVSGEVAPLVRFYGRQGFEVLARAGRDGLYMGRRRPGTDDAAAPAPGADPGGAPARVERNGAGWIA